MSSWSGLVVDSERPMMKRIAVAVMKGHKPVWAQAQKSEFPQPEVSEVHEIQVQK